MMRSSIRLEFYSFRSCRQYIPSKNAIKVYLLLEENGMHVKYWIAECNPKVIASIINDTYIRGDYFIVDKKFKWMITENHHEIVQFMGDGVSGSFIKVLDELGVFK